MLANDSFGVLLFIFWLILIDLKKSLLSCVAHSQFLCDARKKKLLN